MKLNFDNFFISTLFRSSRLLQASLSEKLSSQIINDILVSFEYLGFTQWKLFKRDMKGANQQKNIEFQPLKLNGFIQILICYTFVLIITIIVQLIETIWYLAYKYRCILYKI